MNFLINIYKETFAAFNIHPSDQEIMFHVGDWDIHTHFGIEDVDKFTEMVNSKLTNLQERQVLSKNVIEMLSALEGSHNMAIVSSAVKGDILDALTRNNIVHHFSAIIGVHEVKNYKPHPEPIYSAMSFLEAKPENSIMIGDSRKDIEAANNAGVDSILYYPPEHINTHDLDMLMTYNPTYVVNSLLKIVEIVG